jgi:hypothetical protein
MVLQSKVFLITLMRQYSPVSLKRKTFIRRVSRVGRTISERISLSLTPLRGEPCNVNESVLNGAASIDRGKLSDDDIEFGCDVGSVPNRIDMPTKTTQTNTDEQVITPANAMKLFTKLPFPEPRRVIFLRLREPELLDRA